jgi:hypothetical protein
MLLLRGIVRVALVFPIVLTLLAVGAAGQVLILMLLGIDPALLVTNRAW